MNYFYVENDEQKGPVSLDEILKTSINENTLVWHEGLNDWTEAKNIHSLESYINRKTPPKIPVNKKEPPKFERPSQYKSENIENDSRKKKLAALIAGGVLLLIIAILFISKSGESDDESLSNPEFSNTTQNKESNQSLQLNQQPQTQLPQMQSEDEIRENLYNKEISNPTKYLSANGSYRVNLAANTIIEGTIYNSASIAGFKNVKLTAKFYSKTDILLGEKSFIVMDFISPNGKTSFKYKILGWWENIDHWTLNINSAEYY